MEIDTETTTTFPDSLDKQFQQELAGFNPNKPIELESEYKLEQDTTSPEKPPVASQGMPRTITILLITGGLIFGGMAIWTFIKPERPTPEIVRPTPEPEEKEVIPDETAKLKTQLALIEQDRMMKPTPKDSESKEESSEPTPKEPTPVKTTEPAPRPPQPAPPQPRPRPRPQPVVIKPSPLPPPPQRAIAPLPPPEPKKFPEPPPPPVDPYQRWQQLQALGFSHRPVTASTVAINPTPSPDITSNTAIPSTDSSLEQRPPEKPPGNTNSFIKTVTIGQKREPTREGIKEMTTGEQGIINRRPTYTREDRFIEIHTIAFGTSASGTVKIPLIWDEGSGEQLYNFFAIALDKPIQGTSGEVALPANTVIIAQAETVGRGNRLVQASAIALVYSDLAGNVKQEAIAPGAIIIRGQNLQPLIARGYYDHGGTIAQADLLIGLLSGLGEIGEVFTSPEQTSSFSSSSSNAGSNSSSNTTSNTIIRSRDPEIWSAVLKGFFNPLAERISSRNNEALNELLSRPNIAVIEKNTQVTVVVNSFLKIKR